MDETQKVPETQEGAAPAAPMTEEEMAKKVAEEATAASAPEAEAPQA